MLKTTVGWTLMFRVGNQDKARKELRRAEELLGLELSLGACERYWKIPELWTCNAETHIEASSAAEQVTQCLLRANRLATGWYVLGPHLRPDGSLESFDGIFDRHQQGARLSSLEWAQFQVLPPAPALSATRTQPVIPEFASANIRDPAEARGAGSRLCALSRSGRDDNQQEHRA